LQAIAEGSSIRSREVQNNPAIKMVATGGPNVDNGKRSFEAENPDDKVRIGEFLPAADALTAPTNPIG
jgi:hypothetical protein